MTKGELIDLLLANSAPRDAEIGIYLECTNNDCGLVGAVVGVERILSLNCLLILGEYEEPEY